MTRKERHRHKDRERQRHKDRERQGHKDRERLTETQRQRERHTQRHRERETDRDSDRALDIQVEGRGGGEGGGRRRGRGQRESGGRGVSIDWLIKSIISLHTTERNSHKCLQPLNTKSFSQAEIHVKKQNKTKLLSRAGISNAPTLASRQSGNTYTCSSQQTVSSCSSQQTVIK